MKKILLYIAVLTFGWGFSQSEEEIERFDTMLDELEVVEGLHYWRESKNKNIYSRNGGGFLWRKLRYRGIDPSHVDSLVIRNRTDYMKDFRLDGMKQVKLYWVKDGELFPVPGSYYYYGKN